MNVKELRDLIADLPDDMQVILQKDSEGNGYSPLSGGDADVIYVGSSGWDGDVYADPAVLDPDDYSEEEMTDMRTEWEEISRIHPRSLILYPVN